VKKGTESLLKFRLLMQDLSLSDWEAMGLLMKLWRVTEENTPAGDIGRYTDSDIALAINWTRTSAEQLIATLVARHWLDELPGPGRLYVHDWHEHAEDRVQMRVARAGKLFAAGYVPKLVKFDREEKDQLTRLYLDRYGVTPSTRIALPVPHPEGATPNMQQACSSGAAPMSTTDTVTDTDTKNRYRGGADLASDSSRIEKPSRLNNQAGRDSANQGGGNGEKSPATPPGSHSHERKSPSTTLQASDPHSVRVIAFAEVVEDAQRVARGLPPRKVEDRSLVLKCLWLVRAGEESANRGPTSRKP
jgi:hypothetical protein